MNLITLTTDFGTRDEYVAVMKGVILRINPQARLVDVSHDLPPQGVGLAGQMLKAAFAWFPQESVHLAVVDPGVGTDRAILAARYAGHIFIAPDNGLLPAVWGDQRPQLLVQVRESRFFLHPVSATFHGRDIFAPVAAHLSMGLDLRDLGPELQDLAALRKISLPGPRWEGEATLVGTVTGGDHFGNLRTNIDREHLENFTARTLGREPVISLGGNRIIGLARSYADRPSGDLIALVNSRGELEIAVVNGSAAALLKAAQGLQVCMTMEQGV